MSIIFYEGNLFLKVEILISTFLENSTKSGYQAMVHYFSNKTPTGFKPAILIRSIETLTYRWRLSSPPE